MGIKRSPHNRENPYVLLNKRSLWDPDLSLEAVGLWARLISRPDDWDFNVEELSKTFKKSKDKINDILNELIEHGYAYRQQRREPNASGKYKNRFSRWDIWILEDKCSKEEISNILSEPCLSGPIPTGPLEPSLLSTKDPNQVLKEEEASKVREFAASLSIEDQIKKCKSIKAEDKETALAYVKSNPDKFDKSDNPLGLLITIVRAGDHLKKTRASRIKENKEWVKAEIAKTNLGEQFCIGKANVSVFMSQTAPDHVIKFDHPEFKELISYRLKQRGYDTKIPLLREYT